MVLPPKVASGTAPQLSEADMMDCVPVREAVRHARISPRVALFANLLNNCKVLLASRKNVVW
ncbi:hypothetical protein ACHAPI_012103 [Fusarium lateritium]